MFKDNLDRILKYIKKSKKISQAQIAEMVGITPSGFTDWLKGRGSPSPEKITKLAEVLGVKVTDLVDEPEATGSSTISNINNSFNNSFNSSITITNSSEKKEAENKFSLLSKEDQKLALMFIDFLHSSGYELKKKE